MGSGFQRGEHVKIEWSISKEKILRVIAEASSIRQVAELQNPLANEEITEQALSMLKAKQAFNKSVLDGNGRPTARAGAHFVDILTKE